MQRQRKPPRKVWSNTAWEDPERLLAVQPVENCLSARPRDLQGRSCGTDEERLPKDRQRGLQTSRPGAKAAWQHQRRETVLGGQTGAVPRQFQREKELPPRVPR